MRDEKDRTSRPLTDTGKPADAENLDADRSLLSGEALDDDELDELCDATLATIGETRARSA